MIRILSFVLALIVALTSQQLALARGQSVATNDVTLCSGGGFLTLSVGADGRPVGVAHACPDGVLSFAGAADIPPMPLWQVVGRPAHLPMRPPERSPPVRVLAARARAPPKPL